MKKCFLVFFMLLLLCGCVDSDDYIVYTPIPEEVQNTTTTPELTPSSEAATPIPKPFHSDYFIEGVSVDDVILYFNEVCLDAEFTDGGDATKIQKWNSPIRYCILGSPTPEDMDKLNEFVLWLNNLEGFPGMSEIEDSYDANLKIHFSDYDTMVSILGTNFQGMDAGVTFWYDNNMIYDEIICYRTDLDQNLRNSVILEEIYNGLGPVQDTNLRSDSIIYSAYSEPQSLTEVDELILKLLYHPAIQCGMDAVECEAVIRSLYY